MKKFFKAAISKVVAGLPWGARQAVLDAVCSKDGEYGLLQSLARTHGIDTFGTVGPYGMVEGSVADSDVFPVYLKSRSWAPSMMGYFEKVLLEGGTYLDIGANIGLTTIPVAQNPRVNCFAFEPEPSTFQLLKSNIRRTCKYDNVQLLEVALFDKDGSLTFEVSPTNAGDNRIRGTNENGDFNEAYWSTVNVSTKELDQLLIDIRRPLVVKLDTQGAEPFVIKGGRNTISQASLLAMEYWPYGIKRMGGNVSETVDFILANFKEGKFAAGDKDEGLDWHPVSKIVERMINARQFESQGNVYFDIFLSK